MKRIIYFLLSLLLLGPILFLFYIFVFLKPSNSRVWEFGYETLPKIVVDNNLVTVANLRDYHFAPGKLVSTNYQTVVFDTHKLKQVWFVMEPFTIQPLTHFRGVAHTYLVFDFEGQEPVAISVEARREKGEPYDAWLGLFNKYELIYVWSTEQDATVRRVLVENNKLYMYPLSISSEDGRKLFLQIAQTSQKLEDHPRFYNTLMHNCTSELAMNANLARVNVIPLNISQFLPGYSAEELYKLKFIPTNLSLSELQKKYYISDLVRKLYSQKDFSKQLRANLQ